MDSYPISQHFLPVGMNRPGTPLDPKGVAIHETATPGASAWNEAKYFSSGIRHASAHYFVDYESIIQLIPEDEVAWHAGRTANSLYISIELCHFDDPARFLAIWQRGVWLCADICRRHGFIPDADVVSHAWISAKWRETGHTDPTSYFRAHNVTFEQFVNDVRTKLAVPAAEVNKSVRFTEAIINGVSTPAVVIDDKSYIGARDLAGLLGYAIAWDDTTKRVILTKQ